MFKLNQLFSTLKEVSTLHGVLLILLTSALSGWQVPEGATEYVAAAILTIRGSIMMLPDVWRNVANYLIVGWLRKRLAASGAENG